MPGTTPAPGRAGIRAAEPDDAGTVERLAREIAAQQDQAEHVIADADRWRTVVGPDDLCERLGAATRAEVVCGWTPS